MTTETITAHNFKDVKVWSDTMKREWRIYVHTLDGREGCHYITGNRYHPAKSYDGQLTEVEWQQARALAVQDGKWHTMYFTPAPWEKKNEQTKSNGPTRYSNRRERCPDCGGYDCGGGNCNSNRF